MATHNAFSFISFICMLLTLFFQASLAHSNVHSHPPFSFIKSLEGSKKGDNIQGIYKLKKYLHHFGYLDTKHLNANNTNLFDDYVELAIKAYQVNFNLKPTGLLDTKTVSYMMRPRCGMADIVNGTTRMNAARYSTKYAFFDGKPTWPLSKKVLNYALGPGSFDFSVRAMEWVFLKWSSVTPFSYGFGNDYSSADIKIDFQKIQQGDGPGIVVAYAAAPTYGILVFDNTIKWVGEGQVPKDAYDFPSVGLHEVGHILGLGHSSVEDAIMWPFIKAGQVKQDLNDDDVNGMRALYPPS